MEGLGVTLEHGEPARVGIFGRMALFAHEVDLFKRRFIAKYAQAHDRSMSAAAANAVRLPTPGKPTAKPSP